MTSPSTINVLFMASEADPLIKVGGLGDVAGSLPRALMDLNTAAGDSAGIDIRLVIPFHPGIHLGSCKPQLVAEYAIRATGQEIPVQAYKIDLDGLTVYLIRGMPIDQSSGVYSVDLVADGYKYVFFSLAALILPRILKWQIDILHANDWHTSAAVYAAALNRTTDPFYRRIASLLTAHNLPYLGAMTGPALDAFDLPAAENTSLPEWAVSMALPLGLLTADLIVAVSPGYSKEILTEEFGSGLHAFLKAHSKKITGILNGLDIQKWNPATDDSIAVNYSAQTLQERIINKSFLQDELGLNKEPHTPLLAMVTRMDPQKGVDLAVDAVRSLLESAPTEIPSFQAVFLGTGNPVLEQQVSLLQQDFPNRVCVKITYNEELSRHIYAGADILLMPSRYEPCGLSQMIAMHYGCVPIAHATGGLSDTIHDPVDTDASTGFLFHRANTTALTEAIQRALSMYTQYPGSWQEMQIRGMDQDFSWDRSAREYLEQYKKLHSLRKVPGKYV